MQLSADTITPPASPEVYRHQAERPSANETPLAEHAAVAARRTVALSGDIVTLSTSQEDSPPKMKASQPVSSEEKQALLQPNSPYGGFSVYG
ncbi:hypothetical protein FO488_07875 [Geobacter sp. FeAm09]|uniref:hypothetical protein n=1 Tax=Geobacter sp. FeAm09 TaxID=2597769 RepID=UPI0011EBD811|nr:hypothetical protein [Geobacter sp. FeAm09]QEM68086.1 hypothetical protein FO488_07875 [Geobacter sp. FeAm09]